MASNPADTELEQEADEYQEPYEGLGEDLDVEEQEDGSAIVKIQQPGTKKDEDPDFFANLAEQMTQAERKALALNLIQLLDDDKRSREPRDKIYAEGIRRTGLGDEAPGGASFPGASRAVHPAMMEACVDYASRVMKEIFPPGGPVKDSISGTPTKEVLIRASRVKRHMNWQMTKDIPEFRYELEQTLTQSALSGAGYIYLFFDDTVKRPRPIFYPIDFCYLPEAASSFYSADRFTLVDPITDDVFRERITAGLYFVENPDSPPTASLPLDDTSAKQASDKVEGKEASSLNQDGQRAIYKVFLRYSDIFPDDGGPGAYIVEIDEVGRDCVRICRNWDPTDEEVTELRTALDHVVEFPMTIWRGAMPVGFAQMIGSLSGAATGALRALLDAALVNNFPGGVRLTGQNGTTVQYDPTGITDLQGQPGTDDVRKVFMPNTYNQPSPVLFQLLGFAVEAARGVIRTSLEDTAESNQNTPVGTTLARIEQGMVVFSNLHQRQHNAMARMLDILYRINKYNLNEKVLLHRAGELLATRKDYEGPPVISPVSDPNIFSEMQRAQQVNYVQGRAAATAQMGLYNLRKVEEMGLETLKIPNAKELLAEEPKPTKLNAVNENMAATMGRPIAAFPDQDHMAHMKVHLGYAFSLGVKPPMNMPLLPAMVQHLKEHATLYYGQQVYDMLSQLTEAEGVTPEELMGDNSEVSAKFDKLLAETADEGLAKCMQDLAEILGILGQMVEMVQQMQPPPPMDPAQLMAAETQRKAQADQVKAQLDSKEQQLKESKAMLEAQENQKKEEQARQEAEAKRQADLQKEALRLQAQQALQAQKDQGGLAKESLRQTAEDRRTAEELASEEARNREDNQTALTIAGLEAVSGEKVAVSTGTGINP